MANTTAERKTESITVTAKRIPLEEQKDLPPFVKENVLNRYRSYTYNFTLAALNKSQVANPDSYRKKGYNFDFVILKTGGKGPNGYNSAASSGLTVTKTIDNENELGTYQTTENSIQLGKDLVEEYNQKSPGRFDMFIDNIDIETLMSFTPGTNTSFATKINFEVFEPYSINGFPQALHVGAVSSGYASYVGASYVLVMEFIGYPDDKTVPDPEPIEYSKRYFVVKFSKFDAEITEKGTKYICQCIPYNDTAMGNPNVLKEPIQMTGNTVGDILQNFEESINLQIKESDKDTKSTENATKFDKYEIRFGEIVDNKLSYENNINIFSRSKVLELLKDKALYRFPDPGNPNQVAPNQQRSATQASIRQVDNAIVSRDVALQGSAQRYPPAVQQTTPTDRGTAQRFGPGPTDSAPTNTVQPQASSTPAQESRYFRYTPDKIAVQFSEKARIHECIIAILRDCEYTRGILEKLDEYLDDNDMVEYFAVLTEVEVSEIDEVTRRNFQIFRYIVVPHKIHFTRIPGYQGQKYDTKKLQNKVLRNYNYIYSGKNQDLINFKLNFNTLFFEGMPKALGSSDYRFYSDTLATENEESKGSLAPESVTNIQRDSIGTPQVNIKENYQQLPNIGIAGPTNVKPFDVMTRNMHEAIINPKGSMLTGEVEIIGDPLYLTTTGQGNYKPAYINSDSNLTIDGELSYTFREVFINILFRNPIDIGINGMYVFEKDKVPFSGVYRVNKVKSSFKEGVFRQILEVIRMPGQFVNPGEVQTTDPAKRLEFLPDPYNRLVADTTPAVNRPPIAAQGVNLLAQISSLANSITGVGASITGAIQGITSNVAQNIQQVTNKITSAVTGVTQEVAGVASKLGITLNELQNATPAQLAQLALFAKTIPDTVNPKASADQGVALAYVPVEKYQNLPAVAPKVSAPDVEINTVDIENLMKAGGAAALALAFGVNNASKISSSQLTKGNASDLIGASSSRITNPLANLVNQGNVADNVINASKTYSSANLVSNSLEVNQKVAGVSISSDLNKSVTAVYGSKIESPLKRYIDKTTV